jgi:hypothetical protein
MIRVISQSDKRIKDMKWGFNGQQKFLHYAVINHETGEFHSLKQEYTTMSRRPGIAADWFAKYYEDVYPSVDNGIV